MRTSRWLYLLILVLAAREARAQQGARMTFDASFGVGTGRGIDTDGARTGPAIDVLLSRLNQLTEREGRVLAVAISIQAPWSGTLTVCEAFAPEAGGFSGCGGNDFPGFFSAGVLYGVQRSNEGSTRVLAGPAYFNDGDDGHALGFQGRVDLASRAFSRISLMASLRGSALQFRGNLLYLGAFGLGFRLQ